jgi:hypothetical protein
MRNTIDVTGAKSVNDLVTFYNIHGGKGEVLFFCSICCFDVTRESGISHFGKTRRSRFTKIFEMFLLPVACSP